MVRVNSAEAALPGGPRVLTLRARPPLRPQSEDRAILRFRVRYLRAVTVLLYMGPLLAGLAGFGWALLPPFLFIYLLWLYMLRPHQWPQTAAEWLSVPALGAVLTQVLSQLLLVAVLFGIGRGIGGVTGSLPMFHPMLPVAISMLALPLMRMVWNPERALEQGTTIDDIMDAVDTASPLADPAAVAAGLLALPQDTTAETALPLLRGALQASDGPDATPALAAALAAAPAARHPGLREAVVLWGTDPESFVSGTAPEGLRAAFAAAGRDERLLRQLLPRAAALVRAFPDRSAQFPSPSVLAGLGQGLDPTLASDLSSLSDLLAGAPAASQAA